MKTRSSKEVSSPPARQTRSDASRGAATHDDDGTSMGRHAEEVPNEVREVLDRQSASGFSFYRDLCALFQTSPNPEVALAIMNKHHRMLCLSRDFGLRDMLPLSYYLSHPKFSSQFDVLSLSHCDLGCSAALALERVLKKNTTLRKLDLSYNRIEISGAYALARGLAGNTSLTHLRLRGNCLNAECARVLAEHGLDHNATLLYLDISNNNIQIQGAHRLLQAMERSRASRASKGLSSTPVRAIVGPLTHDHTRTLHDCGRRIITEGNFVMEELLNSITHGVGVFLAIMGVIYMLQYAQASKLSGAYLGASVIYCLSLVVLYTCSTLAHSFHRMRVTGNVFMILDHSCISLLIAGSYTPVCLVTLGHSWVGYLLCKVVWLLALLGITLSVNQMDNKYELAVYLLMGWVGVLPAKAIIQCMPTEGLVLFGLGGLAYTSGVYFFQKGKTLPAYHSIWHLFVLLGSVLHYFAILYYVRPCPLIEPAVPIGPYALS